MRKYTKPTSIPPKQNKIYPITANNPNNIHYPNDPNTKVPIIILKITVTIWLLNKEIYRIIIIICLYTGIPNRINTKNKTNT